jgi:hypothetical protein
MKKKYAVVSAGLLLILASAGSLQAIPAFARKYSMTCKTCHAPFPRLKKFGLDFAANGYALKDKPAPRAVVDTGDSLLNLLRELPLALRFDGFATFNNSNTMRLDFASPAVIKLLSGGEIAKNLSYYLYFMMTEMGEVVGLEDAFLMLRNVLGTGLDLSVGQFQVSDPIFKRELRLMLEDYQIYNARPGLSRINLTYDRGIMLTYRLPSRTDLTLEILNGMGLTPAGDKANYDYDKFKCFLARVSQDLGDRMRLGGFGYLGWEKQYNVRNDIWMLGADAVIDSPPFTLSAQYVERRDNNPTFAYEFVPADVPSIATRGAFAELVFLPEGDDSRWYAAGLFNWVSSDHPALKHLSLTAHAGYLLQRNVRFTLEGSYFIDSPFGRYPRVLAGLITGF